MVGLEYLDILTLIYLLLDLMLGKNHVETKKCYELHKYLTKTKISFSLSR